MVTPAMAAAVREASGASGLAAVLLDAARRCVVLAGALPRQRFRVSPASQPASVTADRDAALLLDVARLYLLVLQTVPDRPGLRHHADLLASGSTLDDLAASLLAFSGLDRLDEQEAARDLWSRAGGTSAAFERAWRRAATLPKLVASLVREPLGPDVAPLSALFPYGIDPDDHDLGPAWGYRLWACEIDRTLVRLAGRVSVLLRLLGPRIALTLRIDASTTVRQLEASLASLSGQIYGRWRLTLAGDPPAGWIAPRDPRIVVSRSAGLGDGVAAGRTVLRGEIRAGDVLSPACLSLFGLASLRQTRAQGWRCDEDGVDPDGLRSRPRLERDAGLVLWRGQPSPDGTGVRHLPAVLLHRGDGSVRPARQRPAQTGTHPLPSVSLVIATRDRPALLRRSIDSIRATTGAMRPEIVIVDNGTTDAEALAILAACATEGCTVLRRPGPFNWSALCNAGVRASTGEIVVLLNNDVECIEPGWLPLLAEACRDPAVGVVGATLLFEDGRVQHAGVLLGPGPAAVHRLDRPDAGESGCRSVSAVTGACMAMRREVFDRLDGLEEALPVTWNDLDFCLRVRRAGYDVRLAVDCVLRHDELGTRTPDTAEENRAQLARTRAFIAERHRLALRRDPFLHPFLLAAGGGRLLDSEAPARAGKLLLRGGVD